MNFTKQQQAVIAHDPTKNGVVRAGPGTGKSFTVVELARQLAANHPSINIRFVTFTRAATSELMKKFVECGGKALKPSTIHSFALSILMQNQDALPIHLPLRIPSEQEEEKIIYPYIGRLIGVTRGKRVEKLVRAKASMWESLDSDFDLEGITSEEKARFVSAFQKASDLFGFTLLSQLPDLLRQLLTTHNDVDGLNFQFMIIDEYQDLNKCEIELLKHLSTTGVSVLAVGDEDQSIYSFRKAHPIGIREFETHFNDAVAYELTICHRCPNNLLAWGQHVIQGDLGRSPRTLPTSRSKKNAEIRLLHFSNDDVEARGVATLIQKLLSQGMEAHEILVLTRADNKGVFSKRIKEFLVEAGTPIFDSKEAKKLLEDKNVKLLFAFMQLIENEKDSLAWYTLLSNSRGIGTVTIQSIVRKAESYHKTFGEAILMDEETLTAQKPALLKIREKLNRLVTAHTDAEQSGVTDWGRWMLEVVIPQLKFTPPGKLSELLVQADSRIEVENPSLGYFVSQLAPMAKDIANEQQSGVKFMSMQSSKGLTARATIIVGVDNDLIPSPRNKDQNEERRLLYVAMTRSQEFLAMTWANRRRGPQARSGTQNTRRRNYTAFLESGPVKSEDGNTYIESLAKS